MITMAEPFELLTKDFLFVAETNAGYQYALVFVDRFSKFAIVGSNSFHHNQAVLDTRGAAISFFG